MTNPTKVAVLQTGVRPYEVAYNLAHIETEISRLVEQGVRLVLLPEFFPTGNTMSKKLLGTAIESTEYVQHWLSRVASQYQLVIAGAYLSFERGDVYNKFVIQEAAGPTHVHFKTYSPAPESLYYKTASNSPFIFETSLGRVGVMICIEMHRRDIVELDFSSCDLILISFAIPDMLPALSKKLISVPQALAKRNATTVLLRSMAGPFESEGSAIWPFRINGRYAGRSGIYFSDERTSHTLPAAVLQSVVADVQLPKLHARGGDKTINIKTGIPPYMRLFNAVMKGRAERLYREELARLATNHSLTTS